MRIETASFNTVILYFKESICDEVLDKVQHAYSVLKHLPNIINLSPSYHSVLVEYDINKYTDKQIKEIILENIKSNPLYMGTFEGKLIEIPVDYTKGLDLEHVARINGLSPADVIRIHSDKTYRVYAIGFMVGFAYLANVDEMIATPRLSKPRAKVPKGSVAIADTQTAIYPQESAGGWNIIGHTKFDSFEQLEIGDRVRFVSV